MTRADHRNAWQAQSLLLGYPDDELVARFGMLRRVADHLPTHVGAPLLTFLDHADATRLPDLAADYVATFDHRKRCCLYLTYYAYGDTRRRGMALLRLKQTYASAGLQLGDDELPDHLAVALEYAASNDDPGPGTALLSDHRAGIELLRQALTGAASPWAWVLDSVSATLPAWAAGERALAGRLAAVGPPSERVGIPSFSPPPPPSPPEYPLLPLGAQQ